ncbi:hypothetical protein EON81_01730 [bacterium]|nr:MAG: hypothetical protein EON81_01730 [bacterium]
MRYISRLDAVKEKSHGVFFRNMAEPVLDAGTFRQLRENLEAHAWSREESEQARHLRRGGNGAARSHYRCVLSFERDATSATIRRMVDDWLKETVPSASVCAFVHRNTEHVHVHVWIDARAVDGQKLDFSPKQWRQIGSKWERVYLREMERQGRLEERFQGLGAKEIGEQGRTPRAGGRIDDGAKEGPKEGARATAGEQAARECAEMRREAVQGVVRLRSDLEGMVYREAERIGGRDGFRDEVDR